MNCLLTHQSLYSTSTVDQAQSVPLNHVLACAAGVDLPGGIERRAERRRLGSVLMQDWFSNAIPLSGGRGSALTRRRLTRHLSVRCPQGSASCMTSL
jgi:hypothetical protein